MLIICPSCKSPIVKVIGNIPDSNIFAGRLLSKPLKGERLYRCNQCYLYFRYPRLSKEKLDDLYRQGSIDNWNAKAQIRNDWQIAASWIRENLGAGARVLDVGCFDGRFLVSLGKSYERFGIEIHRQARQRAECMGIRILGEDIITLNNLSQDYDAVTAIDIIEHLHDPYRFLMSLARVTRPSGLIIISSGNMEAITRRLMKARYWYCTIAEHISFINLFWAHKAAKDLGLSVERTAYFSHIKSSLPRHFSEFSKNILYFLLPSVVKHIRAIKNGRKPYEPHKELLDHPPGWYSAKDHFAVMFRKP